MVDFWTKNTHTHLCAGFFTKYPKIYAKNRVLSHLTAV